MDFSIPAHLSAEAVGQLQELIQDYKDGNLTAKGYASKRAQVLERGAGSPVRDGASMCSGAGVPTPQALASPLSCLSAGTGFHGREQSVSSTIRTSGQQDMQSTGSFSLYRVTTSNSNTMAVRGYGDGRGAPRPERRTYQPLIPLLPRSAEGAPAHLDSLPSVLRGRSQTYDRETAMVSISARGKENSITWEKLYLRAEKVAHELGKTKVYKMNKLLLWYDPGEAIEFAVALLGCFIAGTIAVPVSFETYTLQEIVEIIKQTNAKSILISEECSKQLDTLYVNSRSKLKLLKSNFFSQLTFIKTDDLGTYAKAKRSTPAFDIPNVAYIEFTRTPLGKLSGVVMKHQVLTRQFENFTAILNSRSKKNWRKGDIRRPYTRGKERFMRYVILSSLDSTRSTGLVLGTLFNIFSGNLLVCVHPHLLRRPGSYESIINKYRADILLSDQLQLKQVVINYLENPESTISKKNKMDFSCIKWCIASCTTIDTEVSNMIVHKWLKNLGCLDASQAYSPILTLLDFGGIFISLRDQLGNLENFPLHDYKLRLQDDVFIDKEQLKNNIVQPSISAMINSSSSIKDFLRLTTFGYPIPDAMVCVVDPDTRMLVEDLTVGEIWISAPSVTDEFYHMDKLTDFVFNAKLNFKKMLATLEETELHCSRELYASSIERLDTIFSLFPPDTTFLRTKLIGFIHNGKIYTLSLIEDMFLQNKLVRLQNWSHTSDITRSIKDPPSADKEVAVKTDKALSSKRVVQTFYLQHVSENLVRTVDKVSEVAAFELDHDKDEHFLVVVVESSLANTPVIGSAVSSAIPQINMADKRTLERRMNDLTEQIYKILWIFHKIQPFCVMVVPPGSLQRRYCSLEIANRTVEKHFLNCSLHSKFVKFQLDNVILDYVPHSSYYNESIFSEHLSKLRHRSLEDNYFNSMGMIPESALQTSGLDYKEDTLDSRTSEKLGRFETIMAILEWRSQKHGNDFAFCNGNSFSTAGASIDQNKKFSWNSFSSLVASYIKKIVESKSPLKHGDHVVVMADNSVDYTAIVIACFYCRLVVIPLHIMHDSHSEKEVNYLLKVIEVYEVKRLFVDHKVENLLEQNTHISILLKSHKHELPKITVFTKVKRKNSLAPSQFKTVLHEKFGRLSKTDPCVVWINHDDDASTDLNVLMSHSTLLKMSKVLKETLRMTNENHIFSVTNYTRDIGFLQSCILGIYVGATTSLFSPSECMMNPRHLLIGLQNMNIKDLVLCPDMLYMLMDRGCAMIEKQTQMVVSSGSIDKRRDTDAATVLYPNFLRNIQNIMVPFTGRPRFQVMQTLLMKYKLAGSSALQINYLYQHRFNPFIALRSYLGIPPVDVYLDPIALREGIIHEFDPSTASSSVLSSAIHLQDSGIVTACTEVTIVNPETLEQCYENELGEIWCCSEANVFDYSICRLGNNTASASEANRTPVQKPMRDPFITQQFKAKIKNNSHTDLSYLRTGDLGFIKNITRPDADGRPMELSILYVLGSINETVEILGLTHFVVDLESTVLRTHSSILNCMVVKTGGLLSCLIECNSKVKIPEYSNLTPLVVSMLLKEHGVALDLCCFVKPNSLNYLVKDWQKNRMKILNDWLGKRLYIEAQYGVNVGENNSIYLLSDFEKVH
ncbi:ACL079Cp [Eremothecium gossypii ATCC 10895]|uniref:ACL079Cp n=1 Tax=Eremothecium gossypii (strain ATCC 10895 / CBS 109.51 / FGSC 9923 / NRRL Y-1056) TaxID=284811 RepID=Q75CJ8_EREGS|nr:ACL079Cp [Eremothecium gossypii ATCC 10895]AAS51149.2 ACL079Cp [Eremothecium gossypii ATCC 10895]AEY95439.1 FACL079Cp [Eremothecium gossypii FDAG1]